MRIVSAGVTDVGRMRTNNEDCYRIVAPLNLFVLSDGMGGEAHGEVASALAVDAVVQHCLSSEEVGSSDGKPEWRENTKRLINAVRRANHKIYESANLDALQKGMGATLTAAWINDSTLSIAHVGDSRAYLLRSGNLQQLTSDHSLVAEQVRRGILTPAEADVSEMQSVLLRALGAQPDLEVDADEHTLFVRDVLLLCSDGLTRMVTEPEIAGTLQAEPDPNKAAQKLVELANERGGSDNITVVVVRTSSEYKGLFSWLRRGAHKFLNGNGSPGGN